MELADVSDSKSDGSDTVRVRPPLPAPKKEPIFVYDKCEFFLTKSVLADGINPTSVGWNHSVMKSDFVGRRTDLISSAKQISSERSEDFIALARFHWKASRSVVVFPEYQKQGIATTILKDIQTRKIGLDFDKIQVSIDEKNIASLKLFESVGFICVNKDEELLEYEYRKN